MSKSPSLHAYTKQAGGWKGNKGTRHERGYGAAWDRKRKVIIARDMGLCQPCQRNGMVTPFAAVDHIKPKAKGGTDDDDNLQAICHSCHLEKTAQEAAEAQGRQIRKMIGLDGWPVE
jgi:5-methylcytosine-specific restriction protein A